MKRDDIQDLALRCLLSLPSKTIRAGLDISMGVGKTLVCLKYISKRATTELFTKVLVVAPKKSIFTAWQDEMDKHGYTNLKDLVDFVTYVSLPKKNLDDYSIVILDESHNLLFRHDGVLSNYRGDIIGVTGTPPKTKTSEKGQMSNKYCPIVFNYSTDDAVNTGILNDYEIYIHLISLDNNNNYYQKTKTGGYYTSESKHYSYWCSAIDNANPGKDVQMKRILRMKAMMTYPSKEKYAKNLLEYIKDKVILFANTKEQADKLCQYSYYSGNKKSDENLDKFKSGEITKLSCVLQLNEGVNIPNLKQGIIMHAYGNERKSSQRLGRILRLDPNETGKIHILCYENTVDIDWVKSAIDGFDPNKIKWVKKS